MDKFQQTKEVIGHSLKYVRGKTLDLAAGRLKYKKLLCRACDEYIAHEMSLCDGVDLVSDISHIPAADASFDTIICTEVLEHVINPWSAVQEIKRLLKSGGICIATAPFVFPYHPRPGDFFRYTKDGLVVLFRDEDFEIIESDYYSEFFSTISEFIKIYFFDPAKSQRRGKVGNKIIITIQKVAKFLDKFIKTDKIYSNSYVIVKKK